MQDNTKCRWPQNLSPARRRVLFWTLSATVVVAVAQPATGCTGYDIPTQPGATYGEAGSVAPPPVGCDINVEPKDAPLCVDESYAVFVDSNNGHDTASGTKASPVKTITHALTLLGNKPRIYICGAGTLNEHVELLSAISLYGGFDCANWEYNGKKAIVQSDTSDPALKLTRLPDAITVSDLRFEAQPGGTDPAVLSSVAVFTLNSTVTFRRTGLVAHVAVGGSDGANGQAGSQTVTSAGSTSASGTNAGTGMACTCSTGGSSNGGNGGSIYTGGQSGSSVPSVPNPTPPRDGVGGNGVTYNCSSGVGNNGANAPAGANGAAMTSLGTLTPAGWLPSDGNPGRNGGPGQGGGGGGGNDGAGGGGGCGGCGASGGGGGQAGGSSVALLSYQSTITLNSCQLLTDQAGKGGQGGTGGSAVGFGSGGGQGGSKSGGNDGCAGGYGGTGGNGGAGSGGAGGVSVAILYAGGQPTTDSDCTLTSTATSAAAGGTGGAPGQAPDGNDGPSGVVGKIVSADNGTVTVIE